MFKIRDGEGKMNIRQEEALALNRRKLNKKPELLSAEEIAEIGVIANLEMQMEKERKDARRDRI